MIKQIETTVFDSNFTYFLIDNESDEVAIIDPSDSEMISDMIKLDCLNPKMILLTHSHYDHIDGVPRLVEDFGIPVYAHKNSRGRLNVEDSYIVYFEDGEHLNVGNLKVNVLHTPGHIDDAVCFYMDKDNSHDKRSHLLTGDTLFVGGCGRVDLEYSDPIALYESLQMLKSLPKDTVVYPGHNYGKKPVSTIAYEMRYNPYLKCKTLDEFKEIRLK